MPAPHRRDGASPPTAAPPLPPPAPPRLWPETRKQNKDTSSSDKRASHNEQILFQSRWEKIRGARLSVSSAWRDGEWKQPLKQPRETGGRAHGNTSSTACTLLLAVTWLGGALGHPKSLPDGGFGCQRQQAGVWWALERKAHLTPRCLAGLYLWFHVDLMCRAWSYRFHMPIPEKQTTCFCSFPPCPVYLGFCQKWSKSFWQKYPSQSPSSGLEGCILLSAGIFFFIPWANTVNPTARHE